jgi:cell division initiation protein
MNITPLDIRRNEFTRALRGYNREEVDSFLVMVADEVESLVNEHRELARKLADQEKQIENFRMIERTLMDTLVTAQRTSDNMRETTQRECETIKREGEMHAEQAVQKAQLEAERFTIEARQNAHNILEEARTKAHHALEAALRQSDEIYQAAREEALEIQTRAKLLVERRDSFVLQMRAFLSGQQDALKHFGQVELQLQHGVQEHDVPIITDEEAAAIAALDRELSAFAAATAPQAEEQPAPQVQEEPAAEPPPEDGSEVLVEREMARSTDRAS